MSGNSNSNSMQMSSAVTNPIGYSTAVPVNINFHFNHTDIPDATLTHPLIFYIKCAKAFLNACKSVNDCTHNCPGKYIAHGSSSEKTPGYADQQGNACFKAKNLFDPNFAKMVNKSQYVVTWGVELDGTVSIHISLKAGDNLPITVDDAEGLRQIYEAVLGLQK